MRRKLGKYELIRKLGRGATSTVYLARDAFAGRDVAIKVATPEFLADPDKGPIYAKLFLNEASLVGKLDHPHLVRIYDAVVAGDLCYIVMEHVPGGTLDAHARPGKLLPPARVVELIFKCSRALDFACRQGIIHRDIKPANILLAGNDIKISDFGTAIIAGGNCRTVTSGIGSPAYMSPEQVQELPLDHRTDIYSLGIVMHQLLTGLLPYAADSDASMVYQILHGTPARPAEQRPDLPTVLDAIVARATARDPGRRYPDWLSFSQDLAQAARTEALDTPRAEFADSEKFASLRALPFFADFTDVELWEALRFAEWRDVTPGTTLIRDGDEGDFFCFVAGGELAVNKNGRRVATLGLGECFGEMAVIRRSGHRRSADVLADRPARIVTIRGEALEKASSACRMHFYQGFLDVLAQRLSESTERLVEI